MKLFTKKRFILSGIWGYAGYIISIKSQLSVNSDIELLILAPFFAVPWVYFAFCDSSKKEDGKICGEDLVVALFAGCIVTPLASIIVMIPVDYVLGLLGISWR
jgi:hypothetical protein|tara:strand:+ start:854 stop:1162 length:309 start_codon:yes stop_codon:yes gene_type:complete